MWRLTSVLVAMELSLNAGKVGGMPLPSGWWQALQFWSYSAAPTLHRKGIGPAAVVAHRRSGAGAAGNPWSNSAGATAFTTMGIKPWFDTAKLGALPAIDSRLLDAGPCLVHAAGNSVA